MEAGGGEIPVHGQSYQVLGVWNITLEVAPPGQWRNEVWLWNRAAETWDLIYQFDYTSSLAKQTTCNPALDWGPIVETFQPVYVNTNPMGALGSAVIDRDSSGAWGSWQLLSASNSYIRNDNTGSSVVFLDPNCFVVDS